MSRQVARNIWENGRLDTKSIADDIKQRLSGLGLAQENVNSLNQKLLNASRTEMELRRKIKDMETKLAISETREKKLERMLLEITPDSSDDPKGYFKILGLDPKAFDGLSEELIKNLLKKNYHFSSFRNHPDKNTKCTSKEMQLLNEAYNFFMNPKNRTEYGKN